MCGDVLEFIILSKFSAHATFLCIINGHKIAVRDLLFQSGGYLVRHIWKVVLIFVYTNGYQNKLQ